MMHKPHDDLFNLEHEILVLKPPGQLQNEESKERQRNFIRRTQAIEALKELRVRSAQHVNTSSSALRASKNAKPIAAR
jgi:hypothetical protein